MKTQHWTIHDLEFLPNDGNRYEIIDGELYVSKQPDWEHQFVCSNVLTLLRAWNQLTQTGKANFAPGIIFANDANVVPDVVWISNERLQAALQQDGKLHLSPELVVEVLSPGSANEYRDREVKLKLYSRRNAKEYWIINWQARSMEVYRRENAMLALDRTLDENDTVESPLLPGFRCQIGQFFEDI